MTESADKTEGQQATLHNSAAAQQCKQFLSLFSVFLTLSNMAIKPAATHTIVTIFLAAVLSYI